MVTSLGVIWDGGLLIQNRRTGMICSYQRLSACRAACFAIWLSLLLQASPLQAVTFLFDATKAETAANADWVIDEDNHVVGRYPTPPASGITSSTPETYWTGALSSWGIALVQLGQNVESLPVGGRITYLDSSNAQDLSNYQVYVVCEPNILFTAAEKTAIVRFVQDGGSLFIISDHAGSDRNNDGYDSVAIWNDLFTNNGVQVNPFGVAINSTSVSLVSSYTDTATDDPLINGTLGAVALLKYSSGATLTINPTANPTVRAAFWSASTHTNSNVMAAWGSFGAGRFAVLGDSSPPDDGTGSPGHTLYAGWTEEGVNHSRLILNASLWLAAARSGGAPFNDAFANALNLGSSSTAATGTNNGATLEAGEPIADQNETGNTVWWQFTAANSGVATITTSGSDFDTLLAVWTGSAVNALTPIAFNDNSDANHYQSTVTFPVTAGTVYHFDVDGEGGEIGHISLGLTLPGPSNDLFANATVIPSQNSAVAVAGNNFNAGSEPGEPQHAGYAGGRSAWWRWTAPASGPFTISTVGSDFDTLLAVYIGTEVDELTAIAYNANYGTTLQSQVTFNAIAGASYAIAVDGYAGAAGNIALSVSPGTPANVPVNDNFANATTLSGASIKVSAVNTYASEEPGEPDHGGEQGSHSLWWSWTAPGDGSIVVSTIGSNFDTTLGIYTGAALGALTPVASDDDSGGNQTSKSSINVKSGTTYMIAVDGYDTASGNVTLNLAYSTSPLPPPANDNFASATTLPNTSSYETASGTNISATVEPGEPALYGGGHTVWWKWTAPSNVNVYVEAYSNVAATTMGVFTGTAVNALTPIIEEPYGACGFIAQSGVTYYFCVDADATGNTSAFTLYLYDQAPPSVGIAATSPNAAEKNSVPGVYTLTFTPYSYAATNVQISLGGSATVASDYNTYPAAVGNVITVTVPAFTTSIPVSIYPIDDTDPTEGSETVVATLMAGNGYLVNAGASAATVTISDDSPYSGSWESAYRAAGFSGSAAAPLADPDGDGIPNLLEFAFNLNPLATDAPGSLPVLGTAQFADPNDNGVLHTYQTLTFTRRTDAPNLTYIVEGATSLQSAAWGTNSAVFVSSSSAGMPANTERAIYRFAAPMDGPNASSPQFLHVRVTGQ